MTRSTAAGLALVAVLLAALPSPAFTLEATIFEAARTADLVVVARPVGLQRVRVSRACAYEQVTCELLRVLASSGGEVSDLEPGAARPRFQVLRLYETDEVHFERQELLVGASYVLVLEAQEQEGCYSPASSYHPFLEATEANLAAFRSALRGTEAEPLAVEPLEDRQAQAHLLAVTDRLEAAIRALAAEDDAAVEAWLDDPDAAGYGLAADRRVGLVTVRCDWHVTGPDGARGGSLLPSYTPLLRRHADSDDGLSVGFGAGEEVPGASRGGLQVERLPLTVQGVDLGWVLAGEKAFATARGEVTLRVFLKVEAGAVGTVAPRQVAPEDAAALAARERVSALRDRAAAAALVAAALAGAEDDRGGDLEQALGQALGDLGAPAVASLLPVLEHPDEELAAWAHQALGDMGAQAAAAVDALTGALTAPDAGARARSVVTLGRIGPRASPAVSALRALLVDEEVDVRAAAAVTLGRVGPGAAAARDDLQRRLGDPAEDVRVRSGAALALGALGDPGAVPDLARALGDPDARVRRDAAAALGRFGASAAPAVPALVGALDPRAPEACAAAVEALGEIGPAAAPALPALQRLAEQSDPGIRRAADVALGRIRGSR